MKCFSKKHFFAILFRRLSITKRFSFSNSFYIIISLGIASLAIFFQYLRIYLRGKVKFNGTFSDIASETKALVFVNDSTFLKFDYFTDCLSNKFFKETGRQIPVLIFQNYTELNQFSYRCSQSCKNILNFGSSISIRRNNYNKLSYYSNIIYNSSLNIFLYKYFTDSIITDVLWKIIYGDSAGFEYTNTFLTKVFQDLFIVPMRLFIIFGSYSYFVSVLLTQSINDVLGNSFSHMKLCGLKIFSYWIATFLVDYLIWIFFSLLLWAFFIIFKIPSFVESGYYSFYSFVMSGPSVLLFNYNLIHLLSSQADAQRQIFFIFIGSVVLQFLIEVLSKDSDPPFWEEVLTAFIPPISMYRSVAITTTYKYRKYLKKFKSKKIFDFSKNDVLDKPRKTLLEKLDVHDVYFCHFIMDYINIIIYGTLLYYVGNFLNKFNSKKVSKIYKQNEEIFNHEKLVAAQDMTKEALEMEEKVRNSKSNDFAIRINQVSRLFFDNDQKPILAVNSVSLGIKKGTLFGFLGVNGAGKTTLISMITSMLPLSSGTIEINGENIDNLKDRSIISVCPQFNDHLISEMTPLEHFILYSYIFQMSKSETRKRIDEMINELDLQNILNRKLSELSFGDLRKLSVALAFFGPSKVIFLDEPTTSLDSISRDLVHKLILKNKSTKSILLCTHLLNEAEILCDQISIMNKGCIFTVDSPQNLNKKYGTSIKIDVFLNENDVMASQKCTNFFNRNIPKAVLAIERPNSRIYRISNKFISFPQLFAIMEDGKKNFVNGYLNFTCTSSSLEQTFLEIVRLSENGEADTSVSLLRAAQESIPSV